MYINKQELFRRIELLVLGVIAYFVITVSSSITVHVLTMIVISLIAMCMVNFNLMHPYVWFSGFFCLYSIGYPLILILGYSSKVGYSKETILYELLALITFLIIVGPSSPNKEKKLDEAKFNINLGVLNKIIYLALVIVIVFGAVYVSKKGFSGKDEIYNSGSTVLVMVFRLPLILTILYTLSVTATYYRENKFPFNQACLTFIALVLITLFSGERDFIFRFVLINVFILWFLGIIKAKHLIILIPLAILLLPLSSTYKYYFLSGTKSYSNNGLIYSFLSGEFESVSRNLQTLINNRFFTLGTKGVEQLLIDFLAVFSRSIKSLTSWFNSTFYPASKTQYGFTLVGEGYVIAGAVGILLVFIIVGLITKTMYWKAYRNIYSLTAYVYFITVIIYSIRGDLSTIYSALIKQIFLVIFIIYFLEKMGKEKI